MKIRAIIVEDSLSNLQSLEKSLELFCPEVELIGTAMDMSTAERLILQGNFDLAFLDIQLQEGTSFELLDEVEHQIPLDFDIVFYTAHNESHFTLKAFDIMALDYLMKPAEPGRLQSIVKRVQQRIHNENANQQIRDLLKLLQQKNPSNSVYIQLPRGDVRRTDTNMISHIRGDGPVCTFNIVGKTTIQSTKGIGHYAELLDAHPDFFQFSQSLIVNLTKMERYVHRDLSIIMKDNTKLTASRRGGQAFRDFLKSNNSFNSRQ